MYLCLSLLISIFFQPYLLNAEKAQSFCDLKRPTLYISLGDTFATGNPNGPSALGPDAACLQHEGSYAFMFANDPKTKPDDYRLLACDDQSLTNVKIQQVPQIPRGADLVSITAGSANVELAIIVQRCDVLAAGNWWYWCNEVLDVAEARTGRIGDRSKLAYDPGTDLVALAADNLVLSVRARAPNALIVLLGYPRFLGSPVVDCITHDRARRTTQSQKDRINVLMLYTNEALQRASRFDNKIVFKDPDDGYNDHRYCDEEPWFVPWNDGQTFEGGYYHPNIAGQKFYQQLLTEAWTEWGERQQIGDKGSCKDDSSS